jgi:hypothetical protein
MNVFEESLRKTAKTKDLKMSGGSLVFTQHRQLARGR